MATRVILINEYQDPSAPTGALFRSLAEELRKSNPGLRISLLRGFGKYSPGGLRPVRILNLLFVAAAGPLYLFYRRILGLVTGTRVLVVVGSSPPLLQCVIVPAARLLGMDCTFWCMDAHPGLEALKLREKGRGGLARLLLSLERVLLRGLKKAITLDSSMAERLRQVRPELVNLIHVPPWETYVEPAFPLRLPKPGELRLIYAGNYGWAHDLLPLAAMIQGSGITSVRLTCVGMSQEARSRMAQEFAFLGERLQLLPRFASHRELLGLLRSHDLGVVSLRDEMAGLVCPSKALTYLSQGVPVLYSGPKKTLSDELVQEGWGIWQAELPHVLQYGKIPERLHRNTAQIFPNPRQESIRKVIDSLELGL